MRKLGIVLLAAMAVATPAATVEASDALVLAPPFRTVNESTACPAKDDAVKPYSCTAEANASRSGSFELGVDVTAGDLLRAEPGAVTGAAAAGMFTSFRNTSVASANFRSEILFTTKEVDASLQGWGTVYVLWRVHHKDCGSALCGHGTQTLFTETYESSHCLAVSDGLLCEVMFGVTDLPKGTVRVDLQVTANAGVKMGFGAASLKAIGMIRSLTASIG